MLASEATRPSTTCNSTIHIATKHNTNNVNINRYILAVIKVNTSKPNHFHESILLSHSIRTNCIVSRDKFTKSRGTLVVRCRQQGQCRPSRLYTIIKRLIHVHYCHYCQPCSLFRPLLLAVVTFRHLGRTANVVPFYT